jgi:Fe-S-cluster formation regulator IscX/YfhJ
MIATDVFLDGRPRTVRLIDLLERLLELQSYGFAGDPESPDEESIELVEIADLQELCKRPFNSSTASADEAVRAVLKAFRLVNYRFSRAKARKGIE